MNGENLTTDSLLKGLTRMAWPMFVGGLLQTIQGFIDLFWVGSLGSDAVAALAMSGIIQMTLFPVVMGLSAGTIAFVSRSIGAGRVDDAARAAGQSLTLAFLIGLVAGVICAAFAGQFCVLLGATPEVALLGKQYLQIMFLCSFVLFTLFMANSIFQAQGNTLLPMSAMILSTILNIILDPILIYGLWGFPRLEVRGAACAAVFSQATATSIVVAMLCRPGTLIHIKPEHLRINGELAGKILRIGLPSSGQVLSRNIVGLIIMRIVAWSGTAAVAAYGIGLRLHMLVLMPAFTLGNAVAPIVGQNLGAGKPERAGTAAWLAAGINLAIMAAMVVPMVILAPFLIGIFDRSSDVVAIGTSYLRTVSPFYAFACLAIVLGRALQGAGDTMAPMVTTIVSLWGFQLPAAFVLSHFFRHPTIGIWWAIAVAMLLHGLMVTGWFLTGRWKKRQL